MPSWISKDGVWHPAKEKVGLTNLSGKTKTISGKSIKAGDLFIYEGPDRAALFELYKEKVETLGMDFKKDIDFINRVRQLGYTIDDYLKAVGYDAEKVEKDFKEKAQEIQKHEMPERIKSIETLGGGGDSSGAGADKYGGFGPQPKD